MTTTVFVAGTGTDVGKTWVLVGLLAELRRRGRLVAARKPAQSFAPEELGDTDAELLAAAADSSPLTVCPGHRWYATPMAPPMAATALGLPPFTVADLVRELGVDHPAGGAAVFVEGAGGPRSPIAADGDNVDLARALGARFAILVADAGLGTINAVRLCVDALAGFDTLVVLNRFDPADGLHVANREWLTAAGYQILEDVVRLADQVEERLP
jgi:dethiobiotin synthetase